MMNKFTPAEIFRSLLDFADKASSIDETNLEEVRQDARDIIDRITLLRDDYGELERLILSCFQLRDGLQDCVSVLIRTCKDNEIVSRCMNEYLKLLEFICGHNLDGFRVMQERPNEKDNPDQAKVDEDHELHSVEEVKEFFEQDF